MPASPATPKPPAAAATSLLSSSLTGAKFLIALQVSSRLLTFAVNQLLLRYLSPTLLGLAVQLEVLSISVLYFSRESLRNALQRRSFLVDNAIPTATSTQAAPSGAGDLKEGTPAGEAQTVINISLLATPLGALFAGVLWTGYLSTGESTPWLRESVLLFVLATMLELASEAGFEVAQMRMEYKLRAGAEAGAALCRCLLTCGVTVYYAGEGLGTFPFAIGQLGYGAVLFGVYGWKLVLWAREGGFSWKLQRIEGRNYICAGLIEQNLSKLAVTMWLQSALKHLLTQGDTLLVSVLTSIPEQGTYALASNYGSLIARMLFQPLEESSRSLFAKLLSGSGQAAPSPAALRQSHHFLAFLLKAYTLLGILALTLGPPMAPILLFVIVGKGWTSAGAGEVLGAYCYYIPLLAINGITESFVQSVATSSQLQRQSLWMFAFSLGFASSSWAFVKSFQLGAVGLVWANCVNMGMRICWSAVFINTYFDEMRGDGESLLSWMDLKPNAILTAVAVVVAVVVRRGIEESAGLFEKLTVGSGAGVVMLGVCGFLERRYFMEAWGMTRGKGKIL